MGSQCPHGAFCFLISFEKKWHLCWLLQLLSPGWLVWIAHSLGWALPDERRLGWGGGESSWMPGCKVLLVLIQPGGTISSSPSSGLEFKLNLI